MSRRNVASIDAPADQPSYPKSSSLNQNPKGLHGDQSSVRIAERRMNKKQVKRRSL
jgi:hypothetical protein